MLVAGVWAVAATAVALIALLDSSEGNAEEAGDAADRVARLERRQRALGRRIGAVSSRSKGLASSGEVVKLQLRLGQVQAIATEASKRASKTGEAATDLAERVKQFEQALSAARASPSPPNGGGGRP